MAKSFVILGMHRSATSLVSKALADQGLTCRNEDDCKDQNNPWGYWEDAHVLQLNDHILRLAGGSWLEPPPVEEIENQREWAQHEIAALMSERYPDEGWVLKDPRLVLTFSLWLPEFDARLAEVLLVYRNREQIIASLMRRVPGDRPPPLVEGLFERCVDEHLRRLSDIAQYLYSRGRRLDPA